MKQQVVGSRLSSTSAQHNDRHAVGVDEVKFALLDTRKIGYPRKGGQGFRKG
jgi:hypothetical protein